MESSQAILIRPRLFIGSSAEGRERAERLQGGLAAIADVTAWREGDGLVDASHAFDFAAFVLDARPDGAVLLQLGLFLGALGRERVVVCPASGAGELSSDLRGLAVATEPSVLEDRLRRLAPPARDFSSQVARRRRRSLGTARSPRQGQALRIVDISVTGAFLETFGEIPEDRLLDLDLALENGCSVQVTAKVVRLQYPQWGRVGGIGVAFTYFAGDSRAVLARYIEGVSV